MRTSFNEEGKGRYVSFG